MCRLICFQSFSKDGPRPFSWPSSTSQSGWVPVYLLYGAVLGVKGFYPDGFRTTTEIAFPMWIFYLALAIGFGLLILFAAEMFVESVISLAKDLRSSGNRRENN